MPIFITLIVVSFILYIYFKVRIISQKDPLTMRFTNAKALNRSRYLHFYIRSEPICLLSNPIGSLCLLVVCDPRHYPNRLWISII